MAGAVFASTPEMGIQMGPRGDGVTPIAPVNGGTSGLGYLAQLNEVRIKQQIEIGEVMTGVDMSNRYRVLDTSGRQCFYVYEESSCCNRTLCGTHRGFIMHMQDTTNQEVLRMEREFACCTGCCWCSDKKYRFVFNISSNGMPLGVVRQSRYCLSPKFSIEAASGQKIYSIQGPLCVCHGPCCYGDVKFMVRSPVDYDPVGCVSRVYAGFAQEYLTNANIFRVEYFRELDVNSRALILASTFLIDMMLFEQK